MVEYGGGAAMSSCVAMLGSELLFNLDGTPRAPGKAGAGLSSKSLSGEEA